MQDAEPGGGPAKQRVLLHVFPSFSYGGQQARLAALARHFGSAFHHHVIALDGDQAAHELFDAGAVSFTEFVMKKSGRLNLSNILGLHRIIRDVKPDLLCTYNWGSIEAVIANNLGARRPHLHFEDGFGPNESIGKQNRRRIMARRIFLRASRVAVPSHGLERLAREDWKLEHVSYVQNGVDFEQFQNASRKHSKELVIGSLGALRPEKNYPRLVSAFFAADPAGRARLEIFGEGPERERLAATIKEDARLSLPGATAAPAEAYARFDIFALSSDTEQAPLTVMEAMASGLPVVATNVGDIGEMVSEENAPYVTPLGDDEAYGHALAQLLQNPTARAEIGAANRQKARETFSLEQMAQAHRALYSEVMGEHD